MFISSCLSYEKRNWLLHVTSLITCPVIGAPVAGPRCVYVTFLLLGLDLSWSAGSPDRVFAWVQNGGSVYGLVYITNCNSNFTNLYNQYPHIIRTLLTLCRHYRHSVNTLNSFYPNGSLFQLNTAVGIPWLQNRRCCCSSWDSVLWLCYVRGRRW